MYVTMANKIPVLKELMDNIAKEERKEEKENRRRRRESESLVRILLSKA